MRGRRPGTRRRPRSSRHPFDVLGEGGKLILAQRVAERAPCPAPAAAEWRSGRRGAPSRRRTRERPEAWRDRAGSTCPAAEPSCPGLARPERVLAPRAASAPSRTTVRLNPNSSHSTGSGGEDVAFVMLATEEIRVSELVDEDPRQPLGSLRALRVERRAYQRADPSGDRSPLAKHQMFCLPSRNS